MSEAKYYGVTKDGSHLLKNIATGQIEIYETEEEAKLETSVSIGHIMPIYISKEKQTATIDKLILSLKPFAQFACSPEGECDCHNCAARDLINSVTEGEK